ncbi:MAG TPA: caspase family protein [Actinocrinis sp.]|nr:caspase family protein [Actinocrinis sp.]
MSGRLALVTGVSEYSGRWSSLKSCVNDADQIADVLTFPEYGFSVTLLLNGEVTKAAVFRWMVEAKNSGAEQVVFYFAGHGATTELGTFLVCSDNSDFDEGISLPELMRIADPGVDAPSQVLFLLDCCHSGGAVNPGPGRGIPVRSVGKSDVVQAVRQIDPACVVIAACTESQPAWEVTNLGHGVFTYHLLSALMGDAADHTGEVTANSVYEVISREMDSRDGHVQTPVFGGRVQGRMVLGRDFSPALLPPRPDQEYAQYEAEAQDYLDRYSRFKSGFDPMTWRSEGYFAACRKLEVISKWFDEKDKVQGLTVRPEYKHSRETLARHQSELGLVESDTRTRWGVLEAVIGAGGFGKVWKVARGEGEYMAYKLYHVNDLHDREKVKRFQNGYEAMRMLAHPRIVSVHEYSDCPPGFTMDFINGSNLRELDPARFMEPMEILDILLKSAEAIEHAHDHEVIHRDIKPENIICRLDEAGVYQPYLTDFDLAWFTTQTQKATKTAMGVVYYAAPEQFIAFDPKVARSRNPTLDVFSFGQLMYFCLLGRDPDPLSIDDNGQNLSRKLAQSCSTEVSNAIVDLYRRCTRFEASARIQRFSEVGSAVRAIHQDVMHSDAGAVISSEGYTKEVIYQMTNMLPSSEKTPSFTTVSGQWQVTFEWKTKSRRHSTTDELQMHVEPTGRMALENRSNSQMRDVFNRRVDRAISAEGFSQRAKRHPGKRGAFSFYLEWRPISINRTDALELCTLLRAVLVSLSS